MLTGARPSRAAYDNAAVHAPGRIRTSDLALRRRALYPLSYGRGEKGECSLAPVEVSARIVTLELAETFVIARESSDTTQSLIVEVRHSGVSGFGEAAAIERYGESADSARGYV